jgi:hypothetical protein
MAWAQIAAAMGVTERSLQRYSSAAHHEPAGPGLEPACSQGRIWWREPEADLGDELEAEL